MVNCWLRMSEGTDPMFQKFGTHQSVGGGPLPGYEIEWPYISKTTKTHVTVHHLAKEPQTFTFTNMLEICMIV